MVREFENIFKSKQGKSGISGVEKSLEESGKLKNYGEVQSFFFKSKSGTSLRSL